jgi:ubiquinone/menaquinone biosynthesis C-methylase UbiE
MQEIEALGRSNVAVLDVGCGTGELLRQIKGDYPESTVWGLDLSSHMLARAMPKRLDHDPFFVTRGDSEYLPFLEGSFDVVVCANSFHHYPRQDVVVGEMRRVLKPGGIACVVDGSIDGLLGRLIFRGIVERVEKDVHHCSTPEFVELFQQAGFGRIRHTSIFRGLPLLMTIGVVNSP